MIFSRYILAAITVVGVIAAPSHAARNLHTDALGAIGHTHGARDGTPYSIAMAKFDTIQAQVTEAMAGPKETREPKLVQATSDVLAALKGYNGGFLSKWTIEALYPQLGQKGEELKNIGTAMYHILRSCKGIQSQPLANNIAAINAEVEAFGGNLLSTFPDVAKQITTGFGTYAQRLTMIQAAVTPAY